jgi:hypothetical protein
LSDGSNQGRIFYWQNTPGGEGAPSNHASNGNWDAVNNRLTSKTFTPAAFNQTEGNLATLEHAFLGIIALGWNSNNTGAKAVIKSIKIEYVE